MKTNIKNLCLFLIISLSFITTVFADDIKIQRVVSTGTENNCITQDKDGVLWIGVFGKGLFCYNGRELTKARIGNEKNLVPITWSVFTDSEGIIWFVVADHGLYSYDKKNGAYKEYKTVAGTLVSNQFNVCSSNNLTEDKEGLIWIGTADGLSSYNKKTGKFTQYKHNPTDTNSLSNNSIWAVFVDKKGLIWIGTEGGLNCYDKSTGKFYCYRHDSHNPKGISDSYIRAITEDKGGNLWIGTENTGIDKFDRNAGTFTNYRHNPNNSNSISYNQIHHLMVDRNNNLWICNEGNVGLDIYNINTNTFSHYSSDPENPSTIGSNSRLCSFEDNSGIVWLIDNSGGLNKCIWQKNIFKNYFHNPKDKFSISSNDLANIYEDKKGNIWIGIYKGGMCLYTEDNKFENYNTKSGLPGASVESILNAPNNNLWMGVEGGFISLFDTNKKLVIKNFKYQQFDSPAYLTQDNKDPNLIWFAFSAEENLVKFNTVTGEFTTYKYDPNDKNSVSGENTFSIFQDEDILWLSTGGSGLCKFDKNTGKCVYYKYDPNDKNSISGNVVVESYIDSSGNFWVTTDDGGLNKFDRETENFTHYGAECGFPGNSTRHILEDNDGYLWISTDCGIVRFDTIKLKVVRLFTTADGIANSQFGRISNAIKDSKGNFWFTADGLCKFNPEEAGKIKRNFHIPPIVLSSFQSKEGTYNEDGFKNLTDVKLTWSDNSFEFTFAALDYMDPGKNQYAYKLEEFDKNWKYIGTNNFGQYSNLNPGEYTLRLKGSNNDGIWNDEGISIKITIIPPFWMTWWFRGVCIAIFFGIIFGVFLLKIRALKRQTTLLEEYNTKLNKEIEERKKAEAELVKTTKALHKAELEAVKEYAIAETAAHVAHDIRSPLVALRAVSHYLPGLPDQQRILIINATQRINDITNNLLQQHKIIKENEVSERTEVQEYLKPELVSILMDSLVSEKRFQMERQDVDFTLNIANNAHNSFVDLNPNRFKRMISNLINNSLEALPESKGMIKLTLEKESNTLVIKIIDSGKGIPADILPEIKKGEISTVKEGEASLGITGAIQNIKNWNGDYDILSEEGKGTTFIIKLPITEAPDWFQSSITITPGENILVLGYDESIHNVWKTLFQDYLINKQITLHNFHTTSDFFEYCRTLVTQNDLLLIDYELLGEEETGLDLIKKINLKNQVIFVTSHYEESKVIEKVKDMGIKIIPKSFAPHIRITMG